MYSLAVMIYWYFSTRLSFGMVYFSGRKTNRTKMYLPAWCDAFFSFITSENAVNFQSHVKDDKVLPDTVPLTTGESALKYCLFPLFSGQCSQESSHATAFNIPPRRPRWRAKHTALQPLSRIRHREAPLFHGENWNTVFCMAKSPPHVLR